MYTAKVILLFIFNTLTHMDGKVMNGVIKKIMDKGFGFIALEGQKDVFFHRNSLVGVKFEELQQGDAVTFEIEESPKGLNAVNVQRAEGGQMAA